MSLIFNFLLLRIKSRIEEIKNTANKSESKINTVKVVELILFYIKLDVSILSYFKGILGAYCLKELKTYSRSEAKYGRETDQFN